MIASVKIISPNFTSIVINCKWSQTSLEPYIQPINYRQTEASTVPEMEKR